MAERVYDHLEKEKFVQVGTVEMGLVRCPVYLEPGRDAGWISGLSEEQTGPFYFSFFRGEVVNGEMPCAPLFLENSEEVSLGFDSPSGFLIRGPLVDPDFQQRIPHLVYATTEKVRQEELGIVTVHAVAVSKGNEGLLIVGDKGAGKTSLLLALCLEYGFRVIGNDLVLIQGGQPLTLIAGTRYLDIRECVIRKFASLSGFEGHPSPAGPYEGKVRVYPGEIGLATETSLVPITKVVRIRLHDDNDKITCSTDIPVTTELLRLNENFARFIRGVTTPLVIKDQSISGYFPSFDNLKLARRRNEMIRTLINQTPFYYVSGNNPLETAKIVNSL